jgi:hypothetical protein
METGYKNLSRYHHADSESAVDGEQPQKLRGIMCLYVISGTMEEWEVSGDDMVNAGA